MFRYDAQHTGSYPYTLDPPLGLLWRHSIYYNDFVMLSCAVGNNIIYVGDGLNKITALSVDSGDKLWQMPLTSNVWTAMLMDTLLFVGTSFEPSLTQPTFFCLDARSGEIIWSDFFWTVEFSPVFIDSFVIVTTFTRLRNYLYNGSLIWENILCDTMSVQYNSPTAYHQKVYVGGENSLVQAIDLLSGNIVWERATSNWVTSTITAADSLLFFYTWDNLVCLRDGDGSKKWQKSIFPKGPRSGIAAENGFIYCATLGQQGSDRFTKAACYVGENGQQKWQVEFDTSQGAGSSGGVTTVNNLFWFTNTARIFALNINNGAVKYKEDCLSPYGGFGCWAWPVIQREKFLTAKGNHLFCFKRNNGILPEADITCWPNPFFDNCYISVLCEYSGMIKLRCFDIMGRLVKNIMEKECAAGIHLFHWDGMDEDSEILPSGIYFISYDIPFYKPGVRKIVFLNERRNQ